MLINASLFINTDFFAFIKTKLARNLECDLFYFIHRRFHEFLKLHNSNYENFFLKLTSNQNDALFYTGLEQHLIKLAKPKIKEIEEYISKLDFVNLGPKIKPIPVKTKQPNNSGNSLFSILVVVSLREKYKFAKELTNKEELNKLFLLFPINFDNHHKK